MKAFGCCDFRFMYIRDNPESSVDSAMAGVCMVMEKLSEEFLSTSTQVNIQENAGQGRYPTEQHCKRIIFEGARESTKEAKGICNPIGGTTISKKLC